jgi:hypothetical protein
MGWSVHLSKRKCGIKRLAPLTTVVRAAIIKSQYTRSWPPSRRRGRWPGDRMLASRERRETSVALASTLHWFETDVLAEERNYQGLARLNTALIQHRTLMDRALWARFGEATLKAPQYTGPFSEPTGDARYRQLREPRPRNARELPRGHAPAGQCPQRGRVGRGPAAHHRSVSPARADGRGPGRRGVRPARPL